MTALTPWYDATTGAGGDELLVWRDAARGAGLGALTEGDNGFHEHWAPATTLHRVDHLRLEANGPGQNAQVVAAGGTTCLTYLDQRDDDARSTVVVQCSPDVGLGWAGPVAVASDPDGNVRRPRLAIAPDGHTLAVMWQELGVGTVGVTRFAVSHDGGATFGPAQALAGAVDAGGGALQPGPAEPLLDAEGVLWMARELDDGRLQLDKSCDGGTTWSGSLTLGTPGRTLTVPGWITSSAGVSLVGTQADGTAAARSSPAVVQVLAP